MFFWVFEVDVFRCGVEMKLGVLKRMFLCVGLLMKILNVVFVSLFLLRVVCMVVLLVSLLWV